MTRRIEEFDEVKLRVAWRAGVGKCMLDGYASLSAFQCRTSNYSTLILVTSKETKLESISRMSYKAHLELEVLKLEESSYALDPINPSAPSKNSSDLNAAQESLQLNPRIPTSPPIHQSPPIPTHIPPYQLRYLKDVTTPPPIHPLSLHPPYSPQSNLPPTHLPTSTPCPTHDLPEPALCQRVQHKRIHRARRAQ